MAQAFAKLHGNDKVESYSAGSNPSGVVNPKAIRAMDELGYDLRSHQSKSISEIEKHGPFDAVITMGCGDSCPWVATHQFIDWEIPDPKHMEAAEFNKVRDYIDEKVKELLKTI